MEDSPALEAGVANELRNGPKARVRSSHPTVRRFCAGVYGPHLFHERLAFEVDTDLGQVTTDGAANKDEVWVREESRHAVRQGRPVYRQKQLLKLINRSDRFGTQRLSFNAPAMDPEDNCLFRATIELNCGLDG